MEVIEEKALDSGGVRKQFYSTCFEGIANGILQIFEGPSVRVQPVAKPCNVISGLLKNLGKAVAHSIVMDNIGFPFFISSHLLLFTGNGRQSCYASIRYRCRWTTSHAISKVHVCHTCTFTIHIIVNSYS